HLRLRHPTVSTYVQPLSQISRQNEIHNQKFHTWRKRSALDIVYYRLWSARQNSVWYGEKTFQWLDRPIEGANGITKATKRRSRPSPRRKSSAVIPETARKCR